MSVSPTEHLLDWLMFSPRRLTPDAASLTPADWDALMAQAVAHTAAPQLFQRLLSESRSRAVPPLVVQCAFIAMVRQKEQGARLGGELAAVLRALNASGITPILLKGAHLATLIYPEPAHRLMADFDLMVRIDDLGAAEEALKGIGYETERTQSIAETVQRHQHTPPLLKSDCLPIELHWTLVQPEYDVRVDLDQLWTRSVPVTVCGEPARVLSIEDLLLHICVHAGLVHFYGEKGLRPLFDIVAILDRHRSSLDWNVVESRAREWRVERSAYLTLELARRHCGAPIPEHVLASLRPARVSTAVLDAAREQLFESPGLHLPVAPLTIALAWVRPWRLWASARGRVKGLASRYGGFGWESLRRNRQLLVIVIRRTWRRIVLNWLTKTEQMQ